MYECQLILHTNAVVPEERVTIKVQTGDHLAFKQQDSPDKPYFALGILLLWSGLLGWLGARGDLSNFANFMAPLGDALILFVAIVICIALLGGILGALIGGLRSGFSEALDMAKTWALGAFQIATTYIAFPLIFVAFVVNLFSYMAPVALVWLIVFSFAFAVYLYVMKLYF